MFLVEDAQEQKHLLHLLYCLLVHFKKTFIYIKFYAVEMIFMWGLGRDIFRSGGSFSAGKRPLLLYVYVTACQERPQLQAESTAPQEGLAP